LREREGEQEPSIEDLTNEMKAQKSIFYVCVCQRVTLKLITQQRERESGLLLPFALFFGSIK